MVGHLRRALTGALLVVLVSPFTAGIAVAEGSRDLYPTDATCAANSAGGSCRANIEFRTNAYGPAGTSIFRRTVFSLFAKAGEVIETGSTAMGNGSADILVYNPTIVTDLQAATLPTITPGTNGFECSVQRATPGDPARGMITSRAQEKAGPQAVTGGGNPTGYVPCSYVAPSTGIYNVVMYGPAGGASAADGTVTADIDMAGANDFNSTQGTSIAGWDVTVRDSGTSTTDIKGRLFTYALAAFTGGNGLPVNQTFFVTTTDGFRYRTDTNGLDPNGFLIYGNRKGFLDADGVSPLDHDAFGTSNSGQLTTLDGGVTFAAPEFPISFAPLAAETLAQLNIPSTPIAPIMTKFSFAGSVGSNYSTVGAGGTFSFTENVPAQYEFVISRDGTNFDPGNPLNRVLRGEKPAGANTVTWNGKDNKGNNFPIGNNYPVRARLHNGEYHFPLIDAENSTKGGPSFTLLNPPGGTCPFGNAACTTAFYDDRGYHTEGTGGGDVGTPGQPLCGVGPPSPDHSDPDTGYISTSNQRAYGQDSGGNANVPCPGTGSFGDVKGLDTWVFYPSVTLLAPLNIIGSPPAAPVANPDSDTTPVNTKLVVDVTDSHSVLPNDSGAGITVTANTAPSHGTVTADVNGSYTYTPATDYTGPDSYTYTITDTYGRSATTTVSIMVTPTASPDSARTKEATPVTLDSAANDHGKTLTVTAVDQPPTGQGTTAIVGGKVVYTPPPGFVGVTTFTYTVTDASGQTTTAVDTVTVFADPKAVDDSGSGHAGQTVVIDPLANDTPSTGATFDPTTLRLTDPKTGHPVTKVSLPGKGTFTVAANGKVIFKPVYGFHGPTPAVGYTVTDSAGLRTGAKIVVTIGPGPSAKPDHGAGHAGETVTLDPQANDTPSKGGATLVPGSVRLIDPTTGKKVTSVTVAGQGTYTVHADGTVTFTPVNGFSGTTTPVHYVEVDTYRQRTGSTLDVTITPGPAAVNDQGTTPENTPVVINPLTNDTPSQGGATLDPTTLTLIDPSTGQATSTVTVPGEGTYTVDNGVVTFTPVAGYVGTTTAVSYRVTDSYGQTAVATITVVVQPNLPYTGFNTVNVVVCALVMLVVGAVLLLLMRRRGPRTA